MTSNGNGEFQRKLGFAAIMGLCGIFTTVQVVTANWVASNDKVNNKEHTEIRRELNESEKNTRECMMNTFNKLMDSIARIETKLEMMEKKL